MQCTFSHGILPAPSGIDSLPLSAVHAISSHTPATPFTLQQSDSSDVDNSSPTANSGANSDSSLSADNLSLPTFQPSDYITDENFCPIYQFISSGTLTGNDATDRKTILLADQFALEDGYLYKRVEPRNVKLSRVADYYKVICLPEACIVPTLQTFHDYLGHFKNPRLYLTLKSRVFFFDMWKICDNYHKTCDMCLRYKSHKGISKAELVPPPVPKPWTLIAMDHAMLTRKTTQGNTALLIMCDMFSGYPFIEAVPDVTALTTAKVIVRRLIPVVGATISGLWTDKGTGFVSQVNKHLAQILSLRLRSISALNPRSNGLAESLCKRCKQIIALYATDDLHIEDAIPLVELALRATVDPARGCSPHKALFGHDLPLWEIDAPEMTSSSNPEGATYLNWLASTLKHIQEGVKKNLEETKDYNKKVYDKRHHTQKPQYQVGDRVLLHDTRIKPGSSHVITNPKYHGIYFVTSVVESDDSDDPIGVAYRLTDERTGRTLRNLVGPDRLRPYHDRSAFYQQHPSLKPTSSTGIDSAAASPQSDREQQSARTAGYTPRATADRQTHQSTEQSTTSQPIAVDSAADSDSSLPPGWYQALKILQQRRRGNKFEYLVKFSTNEQAWCNDVSPPLLKAWRLTQSRRREKRKQRNKSRAIASNAAVSPQLQ